MPLTHPVIALDSYAALYHSKAEVMESLMTG